MTKIILIPCCKMKLTHGNTTYDVNLSVAASLSAASGEALLAVRKDLCRVLGLTAGPDFGSKGQSAIEYMPAYERYVGKLYQEAQLTHEDALGHSGGQVLIVSALYGLVTALEPIRNYDLEMKSTLPNGGTVHRWWKERQLGMLVHQAIENLGMTCLYDLLSGDYRKALEPWPPPSLRARRQTFDEKYGPLRSGSTHHRGKDVRRLLSKG